MLCLGRLSYPLADILYLGSHAYTAPSTMENGWCIGSIMLTPLGLQIVSSRACVFIASADAPARFFCCLPAVSTSLSFVWR